MKQPNYINSPSYRANVNSNAIVVLVVLGFLFGLMLIARYATRSF
jgi:hypothetical protein